MPLFTFEENKPEQPDEVMSRINQLFADILMSPRGEVAEELFRMTGQLHEGEVLSMFSDEEIADKRQRAAQACIKDRNLAEKIYHEYS